MANEKRLIDAKPLMQNGWHLVRTGESNRFLGSMSLADVPTVDAVEVVHGRWIYKEDTVMKWTTKAICSVCKCKVAHNSDLAFDYGLEKFEKLHKYCPNCGAKMDGGNEDG